MNKAFVREPDADDKVYCPRCGGLGTYVVSSALDTHIRTEFRDRISREAWYCGTVRCDVIYFNQFEQIILLDELKSSAVYPYDPTASMCACFEFSEEAIHADIDDGHPARIRELLARSKTPEARCASLALDGQCCLREVQRLFMKLRG